MKFLIWVECLASYLLVSVTIDSLLNPFGIRLGWLLRLFLLSATVAIAQNLCDKRSNRNSNRVCASIPVSCLREAEKYRGRTTELNAFIRSCLKSKKITKEQAKYLEKEYSKPSEY